jgi:hypothetical protein
MSNGSRAVVDGREKMRQRFARLNLVVFITLCVTTWKLRAAGSGGDEAVVRFTGRPREGVSSPSFEGHKTA